MTPRREETPGIRILRMPPPSPEAGYELVYKFEVSNRRSRYGTNKEPPGEKMGFLELLRTPGLNIIIFSLIGGLTVLGFVLYMYLSMK